MDCFFFFALKPGFEREVQKQPGWSGGEAQSAVSTNAHGTDSGLGGKKSKRDTETDTVPFVVTLT